MNIKCFFLILLLSAPCGNALDVCHPACVDTTAATVKRRVDTFMQRNKIPGMAIVLYTNERPYFFNFGYADKEKKTPVTQNTIFEIGSISKIFTCLLLAQEILTGNMHLSDPISEHIPQLARNKYLKTMSLEKLATHTSLLPFNAPNGVKSEAGLIRHLTAWRPCTPVSTWCYSNHGVELLRIALEESSQKSIERLLLERILYPLNMAPIGVYVPERYQSLSATGYDKQGKKAPSWHNPLLLGSAALRTSSIDMLHFLKLAIGLPEAPASLRRAMQLTQTPCVKLPSMKHGLGWQISPSSSLPSKTKRNSNGARAQKITPYNRRFDGDSLVEKTGTTNGFHAYIAAIPNQKVGIVIMMNRALPSGSKIIKKIGRELLYATS